MKKETFETATTNDKFTAWVDKVSPKVSGVPPVFLTELAVILKLLWEIYEIVKGLGWLDGWLQTRRVRTAMRSLYTHEKKEALEAVRAKLSHRWWSY